MDRLRVDCAGSNFHFPIWTSNNSAKDAPVTKKQMARTKPNVLFLMAHDEGGFPLRGQYFSGLTGSKRNISEGWRVYERAKFMSLDTIIFPANDPNQW